MAWIKLEHETLDKQEIDQMATILKIDCDAVVGKCLRLWVWADQQLLNGDAVSVTQAFIDRITFQPGFAKALLSVGWLNGRDGRYSIPNFDRHNGETAKKRAQTAKRMASLRAKSTNESDATSVTKSAPRERERVLHTPTLEEVRKYFKEQNINNLNADEFFHYWSSVFWCNGNNQQIEWQSKAHSQNMNPPMHLRKKLSKSKQDSDSMYRRVE